MKPSWWRMFSISNHQKTRVDSDINIDYKTCFFDRLYSISQEICTRFCFAVLCCGYTFTYFPISTRLTSLALWQSNDCPSASTATLMNMDKYFMGIHYERLRNHNKAKHNKTVCIFLGIYCISCAENYTPWVLLGHNNGNIEMRSPSAIPMMTMVAAATIMWFPPV